MSKTIAVFGGTGRTGQHVVQQGLKKGFKIKVLARTPEKLALDEKNLTVIKGDVNDLSKVEEVISGCEAVINTVGHTKTSAKDVQTVSTKNIVQAMKKNGINRIVSLSGAGLDSPKDINHFGRKVMKFIMNLVARDILIDAENHYHVLKSSNLNWTIARPPRLSDGPFTGKYKVGYLKLGGGDKLSRANLADFLLSLVENDKHVGEMPNVTNE